MVDMMHIALYGIFAGLIMSAVGGILGAIGFSDLNLGGSLGCFLTGKAQGKAPVYAGILFHLVCSVLFADAYMYMMSYFGLALTLHTGLFIGVLNTLFSGTVMVFLDHINPCVKSGMVRRTGFCASAYGVRGIMAYFIVHVVYAVSFLILLGAPLSL